MRVVSGSSPLCIYWRLKSGDDDSDGFVLQMADIVQQEQRAYQLKESHRCSGLDHQSPHKQGTVMNIAMFWEGHAVA
jgi:hypothetical protein